MGFFGIPLGPLFSGRRPIRVSLIATVDAGSASPRYPVWAGIFVHVSMSKPSCARRGAEAPSRAWPGLCGRGSARSRGRARWFSRAEREAERCGRCAAHRCDGWSGLKGEPASEPAGMAEEAIARSGKEAMRSGSEPATEGSARANGAERARAARLRSGLRARGVPMADRSAARDAPLNDALERQSGDAGFWRRAFDQRKRYRFLDRGSGGNAPRRWAVQVGAEGRRLLRRFRSSRHAPRASDRPMLRVAGARSVSSVGFLWRDLGARSSDDRGGRAGFLPPDDGGRACGGCLRWVGSIHRETRLARAIGPCCGSRALGPLRLWGFLWRDPEPRTPAGHRF